MDCRVAAYAAPRNDEPGSKKGAQRRQATAHYSDVGKVFFKSCFRMAADSNCKSRPAVNAALGPSVARPRAWLNSAKGGDPMSHGSAERSASFRARHYW